MKSKNGLMYLLVAGEIIILVLILGLGALNQIRSVKEPREAAVGNPQAEGHFGPDKALGNPKEAEEVGVDGTSEAAKAAGDSEAAGGAGAETLPGNPTETAQPDKNPQTAEDGATREAFSEEIEAAIAGMTVEQKVAQIFMVSPEALTGSDKVTIAGSGTRTALKDCPVGGLLYGSGNFMGTEQVGELLGKAQEMSLEYSGQYLFAGTILELEGGSVIAAAPLGQEEQMGRLLNPQKPSETGLESEFLQLPLYQGLEQLPASREPGGVACCRITPSAQDALDALRRGADLLVITEGFQAVYQGVLEAVNRQELPPEILENAVGHILTEKQDMEERNG